MEMKLFLSEREELHKFPKNLCGNSDYARVTCLLMLDKGYKPSAVSECLGIDVSTVYYYCSSYFHGGVGELLENRHKGYWGMLDSSQLAALQKELRKHIYTDAKSVMEWVKTTFGMEYTSQGVVDLFHRIGFTYKKTKEVSYEANASLQESFVDELTETLAHMEEGSVVYYADGVHPTHNSRSTYAWIEKGKRMEQSTVSGRDRININGLLNAHDIMDVKALDCESVNAQFTKELYLAALEKHSDAPAYIISDNARYYYNKDLREWVEGTKIKQIFLPPYSPNLNLIERLWKFLRKKAINTGFYRSKEDFRQAIKRLFSNIGTFKEVLDCVIRKVFFFLVVAAGQEIFHSFSTVGDGNIVIH